ncbi:ABC1 kinase family protein [Coralliovum pocilloporae]|uniref:ABC1 kinase family protein n=1 Tax=Coralliovum pocilloporae TaxID=3066369 RepID=UPI003306BFEC
MSEKDLESNRFTGRMKRYAHVGSGVGGIAAKMIGSRVFGYSLDRNKNASELAAALGGLKGPIMKVAQLMATIPDALPPEYAAELSQLQSDAPPMGWPFVKRRMRSELGPGWERRFADFDKKPSAAASLGQVHRATARDGRVLACKLQYPDMQSAVEADLKQLDIILSLHRRMDPAIDTSQIGKEIAARVREELDYVREAGHMSIYRTIFADDDAISIPELLPDLSTGRLLTMSWLDGHHLLDYKQHSLEERNRIAKAMFKAWWLPFSSYGVIHGDPHLGNYSVRDSGDGPEGINLLDFGCIRIFPPRFVEGVVDLYHGLRTDDRDRIVAAYECWGFKNLSNELIDILNIWAGFIYGPLLDDRVRSIADGIEPGQYGRRQAFQVHKALKEKGPVTVPREFVFMDRAAIGLGGVFLHLGAELNFYQMFNERIDGFTVPALDVRQSEILSQAGLETAHAS